MLSVIKMEEIRRKVYFCQVDGSCGVYNYKTSVFTCHRGHQWKFVGNQIIFVEAVSPPIKSPKPEKWIDYED